MKIVIFGAGAVGSTIAGWIGAKHEDTWVVDTKATVDAINARGITHFLGSDQPGTRQTVRVKAVSDLAQVPVPDYVLVCVKNYSLDAVAKLIKDRFGDTPVIVGFQNGVENQEILPKYFSKVIYGIVTYNAWLDQPGVVGYQRRGPLVIGTPDNALQPEAARLAAVLNLGCETILTRELVAAAHSKMVINLTNSLTTLVGHSVRPISDRALFQKLLSNLTYEGVRILKAAGISERRYGEMPPWWLMQAAATLPRFLTKRAFEKNVRKMVVSSMAQDVLTRGSTSTELDSLNGYFLKLAKNRGVSVPFNQAVYDLCREHFAKPGFEPLDVSDVWERVRQLSS